MPEKKQLTAEEFHRCAQIVCAIQSTCQHKRKTSYTQSFGGEYVTIYQCNDCAMYNPGGVGFTPPRP